MLLYTNVTEIGKVPVFVYAIKLYEQKVNNHHNPCSGHNCTHLQVDPRTEAREGGNTISAGDSQSKDGSYRARLI